MGYTRIEHLAGGGGISYPPNLADAKGNDGREGANRPHAERGQRRGNPPTPQAHKQQGGTGRKYAPKGENECRI